MTPEKAALVIERFLDGKADSIEWCDFVETRQEDPRVERYRKRCDKLTPLVNRPGEIDEAAMSELKSIVERVAIVEIEIRSAPFKRTASFMRAKLGSILSIIL